MSATIASACGAVTGAAAMCLFVMGTNLQGWYPQGWYRRKRVAFRRLAAARAEYFTRGEQYPTSSIVGEGGRTVDALLEKHGTKLQPEHVDPARVKATHEPPDHLEVVAVPLEHVESALTPSPRRRRSAR